jgi:hypothetical protein
MSQTQKETKAPSQAGAAMKRQLRRGKLLVENLIISGSHMSSFEQK